MTLHPVVETILQAAAAARIPAFSAGTPEQARAVLEQVRTSRPPRPVAALAEVRDLEIPGAPPVPARLYTPHDRRPGTMVYLHGGGWVVGDLETSHPLAAALSAGSRRRVVSLDYRLAPEHKYPQPLDDVMQGLAWAADQGEPLMLAGDSAGGNLAAGAALRARAEGGPAVAGQILIYPALDPTLEPASHRENGPLNYVLAENDMAWFWDHYLSRETRRDPFAAPVFATDLAGLPPAFVAVASHDPLRDEGLAYADRLKAAGVPVEAHLYAGMVHGFAGFIGTVDVADQALAQMCAWAAGVFDAA
jgi:acetyl esterase